ncbi:MAG: hypothetical protein ACFBSC_16330 [Microcoleaceae cyanobacterium]
MRRLQNRAFRVLSTEVSQYGQDDFVSEVGRKIVMQRLEQLRLQSGDPLSFDELREVVNDQFPDFDQGVLQRIARINRSGKVLGQVLWGGTILCGIGGLVWLVNLPIPLVQNFTHQNAPLLLLPSYLTTDRLYSKAAQSLIQIEQQLLAAKDERVISDSEVKLKAAKASLDKLPKRFLGRRPDQYCSIVQCRWDFTVQEYEAAQSQLQKLQAKISQEKEAQSKLNQAQAALEKAQQQYQQPDPSVTRKTAFISWQTALEQLKQVPPQSIAGQAAQQQFQTANQQLQTEVQDIVQSQQTGLILAIAQQYAAKAAGAAQSPPHPVAQWDKAIGFWQAAIQQLEQVSDVIPEDDPNYSTIQAKLQEYRSNLEVLQTRRQEEQNSVEILKQAKQMIQEWRKLAHSKDPSLRSLRYRLGQVIDKLEGVAAGTTVYAETQDLLRATRYTRSQL